MADNQEEVVEEEILQEEGVEEEILQEEGVEEEIPQEEAEEEILQEEGKIKIDSSKWLTYVIVLIVFLIRKTKLFAEVCRYNLLDYVHLIGIY